MSNAIGAEKLRRPSRIAFVESDESPGQRNAQIATFVVEADVRRDRQARTEIRRLGAVVITTPTQFEGLTNRHSVRAQEPNLFGLILAYRRQTGKRVEVVFKVILL